MKSQRITWYKKALLMISLMICTHSISATHIVGGDMTYRCLGNEEYEITYTMRLDCFNGAADAMFDDPIVIGIFRTSDSWLMKGLGTKGAGVIEVAFDTKSIVDQLLDINCNVMGSPICVESATYRDTVYLPYLEGGYTLVYQRCCRNITLANIENPLEVGTAYMVNISSSAQQSCNSSPVFNSWPPVFLCNNEDFIVDHSAFDMDEDSLVYRLGLPFTSLTIEEPQIVSINHMLENKPPFNLASLISPYNLDNMMGGSAHLSIDSHTGVITGTPNLIGQYLVGISVEEFRDGVSLGIIQRDFEFNVRLCAEQFELVFDSEQSIESKEDCSTTEVSLDFNGPNIYGLNWFVNTSIGIDTLLDSHENYSFPDFGMYDVTLQRNGIVSSCNESISKTIIIEDRKVFVNLQLDVESFVVDNKKLILIDHTEAAVDYKVQWLVDQGGDIYSSTNKEFEVVFQNDEDINVRLIAGDGLCQDTLLKSYTVESLLESNNTYRPLLNTEVKLIRNPVRDYIDIELESRSKTVIWDLTSVAGINLSSGVVPQGTNKFHIQIDHLLSQVCVLHIYREGVVLGRFRIVIQK